MIDLLVSTVAFTLVVAVLTVVVVAIVVAPVNVALEMAEARGFSTARWTLLTVVGIVAGLTAAYLLHKADVPRVISLLPLAFTWSGPVGLWLLEPGQERIGGRAGRHE